MRKIFGQRVDIFSLVWLLALVFSSQVYGAEPVKKKCSWCVRDKPELAAKLQALSRLQPKELLAAIAKDGVCIRVLKSGRVAPPKVFRWGSIQPPEGELASLTKQAAIMGKTLCQGERPYTQKCISIFLADDAPKSTLLHEYLHVLQLREDPYWCEMAKGMWDKPELSVEEVRAGQEKEWDVHVVLWRERENLNLAIEDKLGIAANLLSYAAVRATYDGSAKEYVKKEGVEAYLAAQIKAYEDYLGVKDLDKKLAAERAAARTKGKKSQATKPKPGKK